MKYGDYEIINYNPNFSLQVVNFLKFLWGKDTEKNRAYFRWKYEENPVRKDPVGVMSLYKGEVVGFRGCIVGQWEVPNSNDRMLTLCMGDTCVHPDHRRRGLFKAMTINLMKEYGGMQYKAFLNLSLNKNSTPVHLKMDWVPLVAKSFMKRYDLVSLMNYALKKKAKLHKADIDLGKFSNIEVADRPKPEEMQAIVSKQKGTDKIRLIKDTDFFKWRFQNNRRRYIFYYYWKGGVIEAYLVVRTSDDYSSSHIVDYAQRDESLLQEILRYIITKRYFDILTIWNINLEKELLQALKTLYFSPRYLIGRIEERFKPAFPILIRPVKREYKEDDWFVNGVDIRNIENWEINEICSDAS